MSAPEWRAVVLSALLPVAALAAAPIPDDAALEAARAVIGEIEIDAQDIFNLDDPEENHWAFRAANFLHVSTRPAVIRNLLLFCSGDPYVGRLLRESERILRGQRYLYDAWIEPTRYENGRVDLRVRTRDVWTLTPGISSSRAGGENLWRIGIEESNLFGTGKEITVLREENLDRTQVLYRYRDPGVAGSRVVLNGPAEALVPIKVIRPEIGSATIGAEGGIVQTTDGTTLQVAPGSLPEGVTVSINTAPTVVEPGFDSVFEVGTTFELDLGGFELSQPAQVMVPAGTGFSPGDLLYFFKKETITHLDGSTEDIWLLMESGKVGTDGFARTTSPPYPGFSAGGQYRMARADQPDKLVSIGPDAPPHVGYSIGITPFGYGIPYVGTLIPVPYTLELSIS